MATLCALRIAGVHGLSRRSGPILLRYMKPLAAPITQQMTLTQSSQRHARIYGPAEVGKDVSTSHWKKERYLAMSLIPIIPVAMAFPTTVLDYTVSAAVVLHIHWSLEGVCTDYVHGEYMRPMVKPLLTLFSMLAFGGLCYINYNDVGIVRAVRMVFEQL